ncbi:hypothetical protein Slin15195_G093340 [Septoria linicola]|uniref:Uncharacterized protein n=1 Tax=Septoria linicola TaxID=215465 RepID=A0A9Q9AVQ0_9PEZI|nr:hypothetical protein Slin15195_G093340 [Septoria linicola]
MDPPAYEDIADEKGVLDGDAKATHHISICEEVGASRSQHVAVLVSKLMPQIRERAKHGLSKSKLLILPSDQAETSMKGELVGFDEDDLPIMVQLEGQYDGSRFWSQSEAIALLRDQMLKELGGETVAVPVREALPQRPVEPSRSSFWGRKPSRVVETKPARPTTPPVTVDIELDQVNFRTENDYGLYETIRGKGLLMSVVIR